MRRGRTFRATGRMAASLLDSMVALSVVYS